MKNSKNENTGKDPLNNPEFSGPGIFEQLRNAFLGTRKPLETIQIEVTSFCGRHCEYCAHTTMAERWHSRHLSPETMANLWPALRNASFAHLQGWGEPLLHPRFFDFVAFARKAGCQTSTTTCGAGINDEIINNIVGSGLETIAFSIAGTDAISNNARSEEDFEELCENVRKLNKKIQEYGSGPEIHFAYLMLADRMEALDRLPQLMERLNVSCSVVSTLDYLAKPEQKHLAFAPNEHDKISAAKEILESIAEKAKKNGRMIIYALPDPMANCPGGCRENIVNSIYIDADGQVSPCVYLNVPAQKTDTQGVVFGNVNDEDIWQIWNKPEYKDFRQSLASGDSPLHCINCPKRKESVSI